MGTEVRVRLETFGNGLRQLGSRFGQPLALWLFGVVLGGFFLVFQALKILNIFIQHPSALQKAGAPGTKFLTKVMV